MQLSMQTPLFRQLTPWQGAPKTRDQVEPKLRPKSTAFREKK
jgi:hypothetical protein